MLALPAIRWCNFQHFSSYGSKFTSTRCFCSVRSTLCTRTLSSRRAPSTKYQITRSTGKHTNAVLCCLAWFRDNLSDFVEQRRLTLKEGEKGVFFQALRKAAIVGESRLELIEFSDAVRGFLASDDEAVKFAKNHRNLADCVLISLSKNQQHVKSVASNYRKARNQQPPQESDDAEDQPPARRARLD